MDFKNWLQLDEARFKGFRRLYQQQNPEMPRYVQNDLYNSRVAHSLGRVVNAKSNSSVTNQPSQTPISGSNSNISPEQEQMLRKKWASVEPSDILNKLKDDKWSSIPEMINVSPAHFTPKTQWYFLDRRFGYREEKQIRNDSERTNFQRQAMNNVSPGHNEPIIIRQTPNGYELLEGWHRTMNLLLKGAPSDQLEILRTNGYQSEIDFTKWQPVVIKAYIALSKEIQAANAGTGEYIPASDSQGTGEYVPSNSTP